MTLSTSQVKFYAATNADYDIALAAAAIAGIPAGNVTGDFATAWNLVAGGGYLVIAVGGPANNALYYNPCGWAGHTSGTTPFDLSSAPIASLPGTNYYESAAGQTSRDTLYLAAAYAYYAINGGYPSQWTSPPTAAAPANTCMGSSSVSCPCSSGGGGGSTYDYGSDSGTAFNPYGNDFYIGQLGYGLHQHFNATTGGDDAGNAYFNATGAANNRYVYGYWLVSGMSSAPVGTSASSWGTQQAQAADKAFNDMRNYYGTKIKLVIWADIEVVSGGMNANDAANNQVIYDAFVNYIRSYSAAAPGTYSSPYEWSQSMGSSYSPNTPGCYWVADYPGGTPAQSELTTSNQYWVTFPNTSEQAEIWQYEGTPDYNVARVLPG